jgi:hypothetical protein
VEISVRLPAWQDLAQVYLLAHGTAKPIPFSRSNEEVHVKLEEVSSASMLIFATKEGQNRILENLAKE